MTTITKLAAAFSVSNQEVIDAIKATNDACEIIS